ncbi:hypothetical protein [Ovoidimarina sediminis]|uniref:hypothetical protein n=1 Tax=Ovoidimarina sediminis TaxID=3079856 RepID=UPI0029078385|nr:hypothetical protein [Rhodophyticola sp. MJ-SS7]MDU8944983.1 hypothetical protein [Rhodophyticola sp. MJ-SS7]
MTTKKTVLFALLLSALPTLSFAMCSGYGHQEATMSCADGSIWDTEKKACVTVTG